MVSSYPDIIKNYTRAILTPNAMEFTRLYAAVVRKWFESRSNIPWLKKIIWLLKPSSESKDSEDGFPASPQFVETSVANNSPSQDSNHPDDLFQSRYIYNYLLICLSNENPSFVNKFTPYIYTCIYS